jgi:hypothetical protein
MVDADIARRSRPAGCCRAGSLNIARTKPHAIFPMDHRDDARAAELNNLRLALVTFALQLDVFEMRMKEGWLRTGIGPGGALPPPAPVAESGRRHDWPSAKSLGNKSDA